MPEAGNAVAVVLNDLVDADRPGLQIYIIPRQRGQLPAPEARKHHDNSYGLRPVGRVPYPLLFLRSQSAALLLFTAYPRQFHLVGRVCRNHPANGSPHDLGDGGAVQVDRALGKALVSQGQQYPLYIVRPNLADLIAMQFVLPEADRAAVVVHLPGGNLLPLLQPQEVIRPLTKAIPLGKKVQATPQLEPDGSLLLLQLRR